MTKSRGIMAPRQPWSAADLDILRTRYPNEPTQALAGSLGRTVSRVYQKANALGLQKSEAFKASPASGRTTGRQGIGTRFEKGAAPWNKGTHFAAGGRSVETRFKFEQSPHNTLPIGSLRIAPDGSLQRKINNNPGSNSVRWRGLHELVWTAVHGPVPPKHIVVFKPGCKTIDPDQITVDQVECISLADNMRRNTLRRYPTEIAQLIQLRGAVTRQINKRSSSEQ